MNKRFKEIGTGVLLMLFGGGILVVTTSFVVDAIEPLEGTVVEVRRGKATTIYVATPSGEEGLSFDRDDERACPKGARFAKEAWSTTYRCNGVRTPHSGGVGGLIFGSVSGLLIGLLMIWAGGSMVREELASRSADAGRHRQNR